MSFVPAPRRAVADVGSSPGFATIQFGDLNCARDCPCHRTGKHQVLTRIYQVPGSCSSHQNRAVAESFPIGTLRIRTNAAFPASLHED